MTVAGLPEEDFRRQVEDLAALYGWKVHHEFRTDKRTPGGWPDLVLCKGERLIVAELKKENGRLSLKQRDWLIALDATPVEVALWRPSDMQTIIRVLGQRAERAVLSI